MNKSYLERLTVQLTEIRSVEAEFGRNSKEMKAYLDGTGFPVPFGSVIVPGFRGNGKTTFGMWRFDSPAKNNMLSNPSDLYIQKRKLLLGKLIQVTPDLARMGIPAFQEFQRIVSEACFPIFATQKKELAALIERVEKETDISTAAKVIEEEHNDFIYNKVEYPHFLRYSISPKGKNLFNPWLKLDFDQAEDYVLEKIIDLAEEEGLILAEDADGLDGRDAMTRDLIKTFKKALSVYSHCVVATESYEGTYTKDKLVIESNTSLSLFNSSVGNPLFFRTDPLHGSVILLQPALVAAVISAVSERASIISSANPNLFNGGLASKVSEKGFDSTFIDILSGTSTTLGSIDATIILEIREDSAEQDVMVQRGLLERYAGTGTIAIGISRFKAAFVRFRKLAISAITKDRSFFHSSNSGGNHAGQDLVDLRFELEEEFNKMRDEDGVIDFDAGSNIKDENDNSFTSLLKNLTS